MDSLIKQTRKKSTGPHEKTGEVSGTSREKKIPPRKSVSFKEGANCKEQSFLYFVFLPCPGLTEFSVFADKKSPNWFQRQFSRQMSNAGDHYDPVSDLDHAAAVAATAYAITCLEETWTQTRGGYELETALRRPRSSREDILPLQEPRSSSRRLSGQFSFRESERRDGKPPEPKSPARKTREKSPSMRKSRTFAVTLGGSGAKQTGDSADKIKRPVSPFAEPDIKPPPTRTRSDRGVPPPPPPREIGKQSPSRSVRSDDSAADAWEKAELAKIKERYEKLSRKIDSWEAKKRDKARRKLEKTERELDQKRRRALERFREDTEYIDQIASGARAQAEKQRKSEEKKVKEKADVIRRTGELPAKPCLCF
ncbi:PREDICTED: uncharacterized protein LOC104807117 isoform X2 [Tarenaya hassleriana]|uniref:uncharacterized protein LOC104807117 isoform X2 n=1 Tax=Tarenaya hassleriana TaxID=28532 RepID=UPI00053C5962|nr:PREDICTED: uncharacterized protein LOC104807117 isoform X2 [Tarenaya hassleriana]